MKKFEYKTAIGLFGNCLSDNYLWLIGRQGWELVNFVVTDNGTFHYVFKREVNG